MRPELQAVVPLSHRASFAEARTAFCHDDIATAGRLFETMARSLPDSAEVRLYAACARARLSESVSADEREALEQLAREALGTRQSLALPLCILAQAAARRGEIVAARRLFRRAAEADPLLIDARRGLRMVEHGLRRPGRWPDERARRARSASRRALRALTARALVLAVVIMGVGAIVQAAS